MILETLIQIISISLALALLGTLCATFTYYARYKLDNLKKAPVAPKAPEWALPTQMMAEPVIIAKKRLRFQNSTQNFKESVS
jgi:hypothetical protein